MSSSTFSLEKGILFASKRLNIRFIFACIRFEPNIVAHPSLNAGFLASSQLNEKNRGYSRKMFITRAYAMQQVDLAAAQYLFGVRLLYDYGLCQISICCILKLYGNRGKMFRSVPTSLSMPRKPSRSYLSLRKYIPPVIIN